MAAPLILDRNETSAVPAPIAHALAGRFAVVRRLAGSAMSDVVLARQRDLGREVAVKVLNPAFAHDIEARGRFAREARTQAALVHPAIVPVHEYVGRGPLPYFVMPYVAGRSLASWPASIAPRAVAAFVAILADVAEALGVVHAHGVVHRDVKPANILVDGAGRGLLTDFGVAIVSTSDQSRSEASRAMGTPGYMAPEQIVGAQDYDGRGDLYSLGVVAFELFAGRSPFGTGPAELIAARQLAWDAPPLDTVAAVPAPLAAIVERCLQHDPRRRWKDGAALAAALRAVLRTP